MGNSAQSGVPTPTSQLNTANLDQKTAGNNVVDNKPGDPAKKPPCKACCACPETKKARDQCIMEKGEANCKDLIEAHKECMRKMGFNI